MCDADDIYAYQKAYNYFVFGGHRCNMVVNMPPIVNLWMCEIDTVGWHGEH